MLQITFTEFNACASNSQGHVQPIKLIKFVFNVIVYTTSAKTKWDEIANI